MPAAFTNVSLYLAEKRLRGELSPSGSRETKWTARRPFTHVDCRAKYAQLIFLDPSPSVNVIEVGSDATRTPEAVSLARARLRLLRSSQGPPPQSVPRVRPCFDMP